MRLFSMWHDMFICVTWHIHNLSTWRNSLCEATHIVIVPMSVASRHIIVSCFRFMMNCFRFIVSCFRFIAHSDATHYDLCNYVQWIDTMCNESKTNHNTWHNLFVHVTWLKNTSSAWHDSFIRVTWLLHHLLTWLIQRSAGSLYSLTLIFFLFA